MRGGAARLLRVCRAKTIHLIARQRVASVLASPISCERVLCTRWSCGEWTAEEPRANGCERSPDTKDHNRCPVRVDVSRSPKTLCTRSGWLIC